MKFIGRSDDGPVAPSTLETDEGESQIQGQHRLHSKILFPFLPPNKNKKTRKERRESRARDMAELVENLSVMCKALRQTPAIF